MDYSANCVSGDDLFVDDLLDLSNGFPEDEGDENKPSPPANKEGDKETLTNKSPPSVKQDFGSELGLPGADLDNLEWLSHFVEDSFSDYSLAYSAFNLPEKSLKIHPDGEILVREKSCFTGPEREKSSTRIWPPSISFSSSSSTTAINFRGQLLESVENKPPARKPKKKMEKRAGIGAKQCSHCGVQKTPLWRTGPLGEKTLCNACGVRFKSGRLLPEYRPASSPTFSSGLHSNSHRKVLEMRQKKETEPVQSF